MSIRLKDREEEITALFEWIDDDMDRYTEIINFGKKLETFPEDMRLESNEVKGCQSKVWLTHSYQDNRIYFLADSNTTITKGIVAILVYLWSGLSPQEIDDASLEVLDRIELRQHLTSQRSNGLTAMIQRMKAIANSYK